MGKKETEAEAKTIKYDHHSSFGDDNNNKRIRISLVRGARRDIVRDEGSYCFHASPSHPRTLFLFPSFISIFFTFFTVRFFFLFLFYFYFYLVLSFLFSLLFFQYQF